MKPFEIAGMKVPVGHRKDVKIRISEFYTATPVFIPVTVIHGSQSGPVLYIVAAVHGDEINGIEMVRQIRADVDAHKLRGTLILVHIANPISFTAMTRDLPDGRDLNRFFPGRDRGSMAVIGRGAAVADLGWIRFRGHPAWLAWIFIHILYLIEFENRLLVLVQWAWNYLTWNRGARLITGPSPLPLVPGDAPAGVPGRQDGASQAPQRAS